MQPLVALASTRRVTSAGEKPKSSLTAGRPRGLCFSMDENYILLPHGVNFQEAIFPDTQENRRMFASLFQFSNCSQAQHALSFSSDWEIQEDNRLMCSSVQKALFEEEDRVKKLQQKVATLEKRNKQLRDRVKKVKRSLRQARKNTRHMEQMNRKLSEKLSSAGGQIPYINSLKQENSHATYLKV
nr:coiled-coil domain-containing protein 3 [Anser cygnoides]